MTIELMDVSEKGGSLKAEGFGDGQHPISHPQAALEAATQSQSDNLQIHAYRASRQWRINT